MQCDAPKAPVEVLAGELLVQVAAQVPLHAAVPRVEQTQLHLLLHQLGRVMGEVALVALNISL